MIPFKQCSPHEDIVGSDTAILESPAITCSISLTEHEIRSPTQFVAEPSAGSSKGKAVRADLLDPLLTTCRRLFLRNCKLSMSIGCYDYEKRSEQFVMVNVDIFVPLNSSTPSCDELNEVVDYDLIRRTVLDIAEQGHIHLQETLCDRILHTLLAHPSIVAARVSTEKLDVYPDCDGVGVEVFGIKPTL